MNRKRTLRLATYSDIDSTSQSVSLSNRALALQNRIHRKSGGVSKANRDQGFRPAFLDQSTGTTWLSRFADDRSAPLHVLEGLPDELIAARDVNRHVKTTRDCVIAGFIHGSLFYTPEQAERVVAH